MEISFQLVQQGRKQSLNRVEVGGSTVFHLREAVISAQKDPKWKTLDVYVFGSEKEGNEWKNAVRVTRNVRESGQMVIGSMGDSSERKTSWIRRSLISFVCFPMGRKRRKVCGLDRADRG